MTWKTLAQFARSVLATAAVLILLAPLDALGVCPSGMPNEIFCDDFDWYCKRSWTCYEPDTCYGSPCSAAGDLCPCSADASLPCPADRSCPKSTSVRNVWVRTARNCSGSQLLGPDWNIEDTTPVFSYPFGNSLANGDNAPVLSHSTVFISDEIQATHGTPGVIGTDDNPLVMTMNLVAGPKVLAHNTFFELAHGNDYANTDFVSRDCSSCGWPWPEWAHVICAQNAVIPGCPDVSTAPIHKSIGVGYVAWLDPDPCYDGDPPVCRESRNHHLAYFDGRIWWTLTEGLFPGSGTFTVYGNDHLASMTLTIMSTTVKIEYTAYNEASVPPGGLTVREYSVATAPRAYIDEGVFGAFDVLHAGMAPQCEISASSADPWGTCVDANANWRCRRPRKYVPGAGRQIVDDFVLYGGEPAPSLPPALGACCQPTGQCIQADEPTCQGLGGFYQGDRLACGIVPCYQGCDRVPYADANRDDDIDMDDFAAFQRCFDPTGIQPGCACFDRGYGFPDGKIDMADHEAFIACATGPSVPFVASEHPNCPPHPGIPATMWMHEDFESYVDQQAFDLAWPKWNDMGYGIDLLDTGGIDGPQCITGAKTEQRRHYHTLAQHIQAVPGGEGKTTANGTDEAPLVFEAAYKLEADLDLAQQQDFFWDLSLGDEMAPRSFSGALRDVLAFGAFTRYPGEGQGKRAGLMVYDGQKWIHLTSLKHGSGWNFLTVKIRTDTMEISYYDEAMSHGLQTLLLSRVYKGNFDKLSINTDNCLLRVKAADGFKLSGGVFLP